MAKRSPILGYNHNVRYRGLIWHVQTEDSGLANPHLFTHLFHEGVIVSTRKLVYDAGSDEGAIKSLMQAQHKAVMKDLKKGYFDDKIDLYFVDTVGLLPRGVVEDGGPVDRPSEMALPVTPVAATAPDLPVAPTLHDLDPPTVRQDLPSHPPMQPRTVTADRTSGPSQIRNMLEAELPEAASADMAAAVAAANTTMRLLEGMESEEIEIRVEQEEEPEVSGRASRRR
ncbi:MAG: hypothetical protein H0T79_11285, partial [Deltaproteobacteria bacterium]|nr:hypothetical protein [Deltaproteobacteria bacterium]